MYFSYICNSFFIANKMGKDTTTQLKGIAILLMLWLHLFSNEEQTLACINTIWFWNGMPLAVVLKKICSICVQMYIFLGGYGLAKTYERAAVTGGNMDNAKRVWRLYVNYWVVFLLFYPLGMIFNPALFRTDIADFLLNFSSLKYSINGAWWFLLPYAMLTLLSGAMIKRLYLSGKAFSAVTLLATLLLYVSAYLLLDIVGSGDDLPRLCARAGLRFFTLLFVFVVGILFAKHGIFERLKARAYADAKSSTVNTVISVLALLLVLLKLSIGSSSLLNPWFVFILIPCYAVCRHPACVESVLGFFGRHSTNMWLTHYFFCHYIFGDMIYTLRYPLLIYFVLCLLSLAASYVIIKVKR